MLRFSHTSEVVGTKLQLFHFTNHNFCMMYQYSARRIQCFSTQVCLMVRTLSSGRRALNEDLKVYMHGRGNRERNDSVTNEILYERHLHIQRLNRLPAESDIVQTLTSSGLGDKKRKHQVYASVCSMMHGGGSYNNAGYKKTNSGAGMDR